MRFSILAVALMATAANAQDQASAWNFYQDDVQTNGLLMAFVEADDGSQLLFKCDATGRRSVYAMYTTSQTIGNPSPIPSSRSVTYQFDEGRARDGDWRYYENYAVALHTPQDRALVLFLRRFGDATKLDLLIEPLNGQPYTSTFDITGAKEAIAQVYESCEDSNPME